MINILNILIVYNGRVMDKLISLMKCKIMILGN